MRRPTDQELQDLDFELRTSGTALLDLPRAALFEWCRRQGMSDFTQMLTHQRWFVGAFTKLHPSFDFDDRPFALMCVSALGIPYKLNPPIYFGSMRVNLMEFVRIQPDELARLHALQPAAYWDLHYQAADSIDFFRADLSHPSGTLESAAMTEVGYQHLQTSARRLVEGVRPSADLAHILATAVETVTKGVLAGYGVPKETLMKYGHNLKQACEALADICPLSDDAEYVAVAGTLPTLVSSRYEPKELTSREGLDLYRRALFLCAEAVRRGDNSGGGSAYQHLLNDPQVPPREW